MNDFDARALPDPAHVPEASRRNQARAKKILASIDDYFDLEPTDRISAQAKMCRAIELDPHNPHGWFNLGVHLKQACRWEETALCNQRAIQLAEVHEEAPELWNLGIASTALRDWSSARDAWTRYGVRLDEGAGEIRQDFGPCPVRIFNEHGHPEVVWGTRICPARIQIDNVPLPQSGHRWHDIVLHDGAPNGRRTWDGNDFPVFDELQRWQASDMVTLECLVQGDDQDIIELLEMFPPGTTGAEDWTSSIEMICRECSEGHPADAHMHGNFLAAADGRIMGIAAPLVQAEQLLDQWVGRDPARTRSDVFEAAATTP